MRVRLDAVRRPEASPPVSSATEKAAGPTAATSARPPRAPREVSPERTTLQPGEIRAALSRAHQKLYGRPISAERLDVLTAQVCHETGHGASMHNFNFGGIKGTSPDGLTARCRTKEVLGGEVKSIVDGFRAYRSAESGAADYLSFVEHRYPQAWQASERGDVDGFVHALKAKGYFTADEAGYAASVRSVLARGFDGAAPSARTAATTPGEATPLPGGAPAHFDVDGLLQSLPDGPSTVTLARVLDAVATSSARIAIPLSDET